MNQICFATDQTNCYDEQGMVISCPGSGQDGEIRAGASWPKPRFELNDDVVKDRLTGLVWLKNANIAEFPLTWREALEFVHEMNQSNHYGYSDWRIPERSELFSLVSHVCINPSLPEESPFSHVFPSYYWTNSACSRLPDQSWCVHLGGARVGKAINHRTYLLWPVRGEIDAGLLKFDHNNHNAGAMRRFQAAPNTVSDHRTGLMWMRNADLANAPVRWPDALQLIQKLNKTKRFGYDDWRLPNIRELESICDLSVHSPAISKSDWFENIQAYYWSSTTSLYDPQYAWTLYTQDGAIGVGYKPNPEFLAWAVRSI